MPEIKRPKSTEEILREMEEMSKGIADSESAKEKEPAQARPSEGGGAIKSLLGFFIKIHNEDEPAQPLAQSPKGAPAKNQPAAPGKNQPAAPPKGSAQSGASTQPRRVGDLVAGEPEPKFTPPKASQNVDLSIKPFEEIYRDTGLAKSGNSVDELVELMESPTVASHPLAVKVVAV